MTTETPQTTMTLPGALAAEISRVTDIRAEYQKMQNMVPMLHGNMVPAIWMMTQSLAAAIAAAGSPDVVEQARALEDLKGYSL